MNLDAPRIDANNSTTSTSQLLATETDAFSEPSKHSNAIQSEVRNILTKVRSLQQMVVAASGMHRSSICSDGSSTCGNSSNGDATKSTRIQEVLALNHNQIDECHNLTNVCHCSCNVHHTKRSRNSLQDIQWILSVANLPQRFTFTALLMASPMFAMLAATMPTSTPHCTPLPTGP